MKKESLFIWLPPIICYSFITYLSSLTDLPPVISSFPFQDKIEHFGIYFLFGFLLTRAAFWEYVWHPVWKIRLKIFLLILILSAGIIDEWHQSYVPGREVEFWDWVADFCGGSAGALISRFMYKLKFSNFSTKGVLNDSSL